MNPNPSTRNVVRLLLVAFTMLVLTATASAEWKERVLYSFQGIPDGSLPVGAVVFDKAGNLYGATTEGGSSSCISLAQCGTVYQLAPPVKQGDPWTETVLYIFKGNGSKDGASPAGGLVIDSLGNLYGTTAYGGTGNCVVLGTLMGCGTVFEMSPPKQKGGKWTETVLYSFPTPKQGFLPQGDLVFDSAGNLYGATEFGGGHGTTCNSFYKYCGAVFELSPPKTKGGKWTEKTLYGFKGVPAGAQFGDGANPNGELVLDGKGAIYGTTYFGGNNVKGECQGGVGGTGCGIVFRLTPPSQNGGKWAERALHQFDGKDGSNSSAGVVFDGSGNLYGTAQGGSNNEGDGVAFGLTPIGGARWKETVLHVFSRDNNGGARPLAGFILDAQGHLYGTASWGHVSAGGDIFEMKPPIRKGDAWTFSVLYGFAGAPDGSSPAAASIFDNTGNIYSTTQLGGTGQSCKGGCGTVYEVSP
jgi:hypothetical protein